MSDKEKDFKEDLKYANKLYAIYQKDPKAEVSVYFATAWMDGYISGKNVQAFKDFLKTTNKVGGSG